MEYVYVHVCIGVQVLWRPEGGTRLSGTESGAIMNHLTWVFVILMGLNNENLKSDIRR